ncbi:MAG: hypothetical protein ACP6IS_11680 [Candidatus Asgardarchaeia archaeon]
MERQLSEILLKTPEWFREIYIQVQDKEIRDINTLYDWVDLFMAVSKKVGLDYSEFFWILSDTKLGKTFISMKSYTEIKELPSTYSNFKELTWNEIRSLLDELIKITKITLSEKTLEQLKAYAAIEARDHYEDINNFLLPDEYLAGRVSIKEESKGAFISIKIPIIRQYKDNRLSKCVKEVLLEQSTGRQIISYSPPSLWITNKPILIKKAIFFGKDVYVEISIDGHIFSGSLETVIAELERIGAVSLLEQKRKLKAYLFHISKTYNGTYYTSVGIHKENGSYTLVTPDNEYFFPTSPLKIRVAELMRNAINMSYPELYTKFLEVIIKFKDFLPPEVYAVAISYMGVAGLLSSNQNIFHTSQILYLYGPPSTGKTSLARFITSVAWGTKSYAPDTLDSSFRFSELFSATNLPILLDDIEKLNSNIIGALKSMLTGTRTTFRGRGIGTVKDYEREAIPVMTANRLVPQLFEDMAMQDRTIILHFESQISGEKRKEFIKEIEKYFALSSEENYVTVVHYFARDLIEIINENGGENWLKELFAKYFDYAVEKDIIQRRDPYRFATLAIGAELISRILEKHKIKGFNKEEILNILVRFFKEPKQEYPAELTNLVMVANVIENDSSRSFTLEIEEDEEKDAFIVTQTALMQIRNYNHDKDMLLPSKLKELADALVTIGYNRKDIYKLMRTSLGSPSGNKVPRKVVLIPRKIWYEILGFGTIHDT